MKFTGKTCYELEREFSLVEVLSERASIKIEECGESLVEIPKHLFFRRETHPYVSAGAPYGSVSPYHLRSGVLERLECARHALKRSFPQYDFVVFDGFRPRQVQEYMVELTAHQIAKDRGLDFNHLSVEGRESVLSEVYRVWAKPSSDPLCPTPHATGAAIDLYLVDSYARSLAMGSEIDDPSPAALPNFYREAKTEEGKVFHEHREVLNSLLRGAGFRRLTHEWWHFSYGDQMWALLESLETGDTVPARYGAALESV